MGTAAAAAAATDDDEDVTVVAGAEEAAGCNGAPHLDCFADMVVWLGCWFFWRLVGSVYADSHLRRRSNSY